MKQSTKKYQMNAVDGAVVSQEGVPLLIRDFGSQYCRGPRGTALLEAIAVGIETVDLLAVASWTTGIELPTAITA